jgi:hypothetical protein
MLKNWFCRQFMLEKYIPSSVSPSSGGASESLKRETSKGRKRRPEKQGKMNGHA